MIVYLVLSLAIILAVNFIVFQTLGNGILSCILKLFASIAFVALGIAGVAFGDGTSNIGLLFILGAGFGLVGDGVLALREMDDGSKDFLIILNGIVSFAVGHIFYYVALVQYAGFTFWAPVIGTILTCVIILVSIFAMKLKVDLGQKVKKGEVIADLYPCNDLSESFEIISQTDGVLLVANSLLRRLFLNIPLLINP